MFNLVPHSGSALQDRRFLPVTAEELPLLHCTVSFLVDFEPGRRWDDWEIGHHGIIIAFEVGGEHYSATYLPEVAGEQGWTQEEAIRSLARKAGFRAELPAELMDRISVTRYSSSRAHCSYAEFLDRMGG